MWVGALLKPSSASDWLDVMGKVVQIVKKKKDRWRVEGAEFESRGTG